MVPAKEDKTRLKSHEYSWCWLFLISLVTYLYVLASYINTKPKIGEVISYSPSFHKIISASYKTMELISYGHEWCEGPAWIDDENSGFLIFSDTIMNKIYRWEDGKGIFTLGRTLYIEQSGCKVSPMMTENTRTNCTNDSDETNNNSNTCEAADDSLYCEDMREVGSNGVVRLLSRYSKILNAGTSSDKTIDLVVCQHGERAITLIRENGLRSYIATHYMNNRLNSPNDLAWSPDGGLYFTDPTYGIRDKHGAIINQQIPFNGVFMIHNKHVRESILSGAPTASVTLLTSSMSMPNGLAFSPDYGKLYVSNSDSSNPYWNVYDVDDNGLLTNETLFYNASIIAAGDGNHAGLPDGLKVDINGNVYASGPGGVIIFSPEGKILGKLTINQPVSNVAFGKDGKLYLTAKDIVTRVRIKTKPADGSIK